jgi:hypothetical protein
VANGQEYPIDVLVLSTGYRSPGAGAGNPAVRTGIEIFGRDETFTHKWTTQGASTLHGVSSNGFPNLFLFGLSQVGITPNFAHTLDILGSHIAHIVQHGHERVGGPGKNGVVIEVSEEAEQAWSIRVAQGAGFMGTVLVCTPGYMTNEGEALKIPQDEQEMFKGAKAGPWPDGMIRYVRELEAWRADGKLTGIDVSVA